VTAARLPPPPIAAAAGAAPWVDVVDRHARTIAPDFEEPGPNPGGEDPASGPSTAEPGPDDPPAAGASAERTHEVRREMPEL
jgi:hypothetical protein